MDLTQNTKKYESLWQITVRQFKKNKLAVIGLTIFMLFVLIAILAPVLAPYDPTEIDLFKVHQAPDREHLLGTDELGRDVLSRLLYGARITLLVGVSSMIFSVLLGTLVGAVGGYYGGLIDNVLMRITDVALSFPSIILLIIIAAYFKTTVFGMIVILGITGWMGIARLIRGEFLSLKQKEYVIASQAIGNRDFRTIFRHILPNATAPLIVAATLRVGYSILFESALSWLGIGIKPPTPTWGNMLSNAQSDIFQAPWLAVWPGVMIFLTVLTINFIGDGLRDALDPKLKNK
ncbi:MAG: ABC transporter permease [Halanaerobiales bacterium]|nr:ABC transporter permease [Halanaerobiales bacterium]